MNVLTVLEDVAWIVEVFDLGKAVHGRFAIGLPDSILSFVLQEVHVCSAPFTVDCGKRLFRPGDVGSAIISRIDPEPECGHKVPLIAMLEGGGIGINSSHCAAQTTHLNDAEW